MAELWTQYGSWILIGVFVLLMLRMHGRGGGCCGGGRQMKHNNQEDSQDDIKDEKKGCH